MTLGQRIGQYRRKLSISQEELGGRLGVSRQAVSKWETDAATPDMENLLALALHLWCVRGRTDRYTGVLCAGSRKNRTESPLPRPGGGRRHGW